MRSPGSPTSDGGGIVIGWLAKIAIVFAVAGFVLFDAISVASTTANVSDQGSYCRARRRPPSGTGRRTCRPLTTPPWPPPPSRTPRTCVSPKGFGVDPDGTVHLRISREAKTLILFRWDRTRKWAEVSRTARGRSVSS